MAKENVVNLLETVNALIANAQSISGDINLGGLRLFGIQMPASWTAANLTFQVSHDQGVTWNNLYDNLGNEYTVVAGAARTIILPPQDLSCIQYLRVRSGTSGAAVAQGADRTLILILRGI